ncbi:MAG TPA: GntR family transcriptional regulator [Streptosporangiaceae bacterium]
MVTTQTASTPRARGVPMSAGAYHQLRQDIVHGVLRPNEVLIETELSERLGVSRTPIRESLQRLAADGLIVMRRRRWYVYEHTLDEIRELYEVRAAQEGYAALLTCERATEEQIGAIQQAATSVRYAAAADRVAANDAFHDLINAACGNARLIEEIAKTRLFYFNQRLAHAYQPEDMSRSTAEHDAISRAVTSRDGEQAQRLVHEHVREAYRFATYLM